MKSDPQGPVFNKRLNKMMLFILLLFLLFPKYQSRFFWGEGIDNHLIISVIWFIVIYDTILPRV